MKKIIRLTEKDLTKLIRNVVQENQLSEDTKAAEIAKVKIELSDIRLEEDMSDVDGFIGESIDSDNSEVVLSKEESRIPQQEKNSYQQAKKRINDYVCDPNNLGKKGALKNLLKELKARKRELKKGGQMNEQGGIIGVLTGSGLGFFAVMALIFLVAFLLIKLLTGRTKRYCGRRR